jgi:hypothetical protein
MGIDIYLLHEDATDAGVQPHQHAFAANRVASLSIHMARDVAGAGIRPRKMRLLRTSVASSYTIRIVVSLVFIVIY